MKRSSRSITAVLLTVIYLLIALSPLAPIATWSPVVAHAVTGECAGDCDICGCSPERRADRTCCCWLKKQKHEHDEEQKQLPDCCKRKKAESKPVLKCACPCGNGKQVALGGTGNNEQLPWRFTDGVPLFSGDNFAGVLDDRLADRHDDPPDPPPKLCERC